MILTEDLSQKYHPHILRSVSCPVCLRSLFHTPIDNKTDHLFCRVCGSVFLVSDHLPILLLEDENWREKADEIEGEATYNTKTIPLSVHIERNAFVDANTETFLSEAHLSLLNDDILIVGCSMAELEFFSRKAKNVVCLDIVPSVTQVSFEATRHRQIPAAWICGDGECLPFEEETFDAVIVRQTLHHMLKYYSAICELFRVCKRGGHVLIIDEPFSPLESGDMSFLSLEDNFIVYKELRMEQIRRQANIPRQKKAQPSSTVDVGSLDKKRSYIAPDPKKAETFLADKYHSFSLLNCIYAILFHSNEFELVWPREVAWVVEKDNSVRFCYGPNPQYKKSLLKKLISPGNASIAARKPDRTIVFRDRSTVRSLPLDVAHKLVVR
jgi:SAM-dependent methyltransferase